jgi:ABC-type oligopeptide transport system ATPase subunit
MPDVIPLVEVRHLTRRFSSRHAFFVAPAVLTAVDDVSFAIGRGETFGIVGESGSGQTTIGRCVLRLLEPTSGDILFDGESILGLARADLRRWRRRAQIVFQDPFSSLDPRMRVGEIVGEPLDIHRVGTRAERQARVAALLTLVGMDPALARRLPRDLSGGQRQRVGVARALALEPSFIVADEPVSALDVSVQAQVINLFMDLQARLGLTYLFIAHDLRLVEHMCTRVAVMYRGRIVEMAPTRVLFTSPRHPYTEALLSAAPVVDPGLKRPRIRFDHACFDPRAVLREVAESHLAAV